MPPLSAEVEISGGSSFTAYGIPPVERSIFTDLGPIAKAPLVYQSGVQATVVDAVTLKLADGNVSPSMVGLQIAISGGTKNGGTFYILSVLTAQTIKVNASFAIPDGTSYTWSIFNPLDGQIADSPGDVAVTVDGVPTPALAVFGLLGQIVLASAPTDGSTVLVDYNYVENPVVDIMRLNSTEFRFNSWNRDLGYIQNPSGRKYRYNNVLLVPSAYSTEQSILAALAQPLQRDLKYRAYERAYTALLNDPNTLLFNSPTHSIAFPPLSRPLSPTVAFYEATVLPENNPLTPWTRNGQGTATIVNNELVVSFVLGRTAVPQRTVHFLDSVHRPHVPERLRLGLAPNDQCRPHA